MRWTRIVVGLLVLSLIAGLILYVYPVAAPIIANHKQGVVNAILTEMLTHPPTQQGIGQYFPYFLLAAGGLMLLVINYDMKHRPRKTHGTARAASRREARKYHAPSQRKWQQPGQTVQRFRPGRAGKHQHHILLGKYHGRTIGLNEQRQYQHLLLTAPTGSGKSTRFFLPNLLQETGARSLFIADLKNELYRTTAGWLAQSMQIWLFAPTQPNISEGYNPLAHIKSVEDAQDFAETWVVNTGTSSNDPFWENNSKLLIRAMSLHLLATEPSPPFSRLADLLTTQSYEQIRDTLQRSQSRDARSIAATFLENMAKNERLIGAQMTDISNRFQLLASANARAVTATNSIDFEEMIQTPTAFFLSIRGTDTRRYRPLMACLTQQMFAAWGNRGTNGIACYLDEFANIGYLPGYGEFISTARALRVALFMAIQNFSQLDERYGKDVATTIKSNALTHLLLPGAGLEECRYYSERIGDTTVRTETINRRGFGINEEITSTEGEARRRLMTPDEIRTMPEGKMLMIEASAAPLLLDTKPYFQDRELARRANLPYQVTRIRPEPLPPPAARPYAQGLPPSSGGQGPKPPPIIVDGDIEDDEDMSQYMPPQ